MSLVISVDWLVKHRRLVCYIWREFIAEDLITTDTLSDENLMMAGLGRNM